MRTELPLEAFFGLDGATVNPETRPVLEAADVVFAIDLSGTCHALVYGAAVSAALRAGAGPEPDGVEVLAILYDNWNLLSGGRPTGEFDRILALVRAVKGRHEWPPEW